MIISDCAENLMVIQQGTWKNPGAEELCLKPCVEKNPGGKLCRGGRKKAVISGSLWGSIHSEKMFYFDQLLGGQGWCLTTRP